MANQIRSYGKIGGLGGSKLRKLLCGEVVIQEKIDGSQFSFANMGGELCCRSRGRIMNMNQPSKMFMQGVEMAKELFAAGKLPEGWTFRGEFLGKPKHNIITYDRVPRNNVILFDVDSGELESGGLGCVGHEGLANIAGNLGLESVPVLFHGEIKHPSELQVFLDTESILGGTKVEGIVIKNYAWVDNKGRPLKAKLVSDEFKEKQKTRVPRTGSSAEEIIAGIAKIYCTDARFQKGFQHLRDNGKITNTPKDIGLLYREVSMDIMEECGSEIKNLLFKEFWKRIIKSATWGLAEWYKDKLNEGDSNESD